MIPPNSEIKCDTCPASGTTSGNSALPDGWTYQIKQGEDDESVMILPYCVDCTKQRTDTLEALRQERISQTPVDRVAGKDGHDPIVSSILDRQHLRQEVLSNILTANAAINLAIARLVDLKSPFTDNAREIQVLLNTLKLKIEDNP